MPDDGGQHRLNILGYDAQVPVDERPGLGRTKQCNGGARREISPG